MTVLSLRGGKVRVLLDQVGLLNNTCRSEGMQTYGGNAHANTISVTPGPRPLFTLRAYNAACGENDVYKLAATSTVRAPK